MLYRKDFDFFLVVPVRSKVEPQEKSVAPGDTVDLAHASTMLEVLNEGAAHVEQEMAGPQPDAPAMPPDDVAESTPVPAGQMADRLGKALLRRDEAKKNSKGHGGLKRPAAALGAHGAKAKAKTTQKNSVPQPGRPAQHALRSKNAKGKKPVTNLGNRDLKMSKKDVYSREYHKIFSDWLFIFGSNITFKLLFPLWEL